MDCLLYYVAELLLIIYWYFFVCCMSKEAQTYAEDTGLLFMETSAKTAMNVIELFLAIGEWSLLCTFESKTPLTIHKHLFSVSAIVLVQAVCVNLLQIFWWEVKP